MAKGSFLKALKFPLQLIVIMWIVAIIKPFIPLNLNQFGILPRHISGLYGLVLSPFIHGDFLHLASNTLPFFFLLWAIFYFHKANAWVIFILTYLGTNLLVWCFARSSYHIGASGLVYAYFSFLVFSGFFLRNIKQLAISFVVIVLYGGMIWGVLPSQRGVSWESHLFGAITGLAVAYLYQVNIFKKEEKKSIKEQQYETDFWNDVIEKD